MYKKLNIEQYRNLEELITMARYTCCFGTNDEFITAFKKLNNVIKDYLDMIIISHAFTNFAFNGKHKRVSVEEFINECCDEEF